MVPFVADLPALLEHQSGDHLRRYRV